MEAVIMGIPERRRSPRHETDWEARYRYVIDAPWRACRFLDVSAHGAAVELYDSAPSEPFQGLDIEVCSIAGGTDGFRVRARRRHHVLTEAGRLYVGVEFRPLSPRENSLLHLLVGLRVST